MKTAARVAAVILLLVLLAPALASACPNCKDATANADGIGGTSVWRGMYWSILLMILAPFSLVGTLIVLIRRARRRQEASLPRPMAPLPFPDSRGARS